jgi:hypothetical protein
MADFRSRLGIKTPPEVKHQLQNLAIRDLVKVCFLITDDTRSHLRPELAEATSNVQSESMYVQITDIEGQWPNCSYRGVLANMPVLISPDMLSLGSRVHFGCEHIHSFG